METFHVLLWYFLVTIYCLFFSPGPLHPDKARVSFAPVPFNAPPCEPSRIPNQGWALPPRAMNHRNSIPIRPPSEGAIPVAIRGAFFVQFIIYLNKQQNAINSYTPSIRHRLTTLKKHSYLEDSKCIDNSIQFVFPAQPFYQLS